jgi:hypothetical protein
MKPVGHSDATDIGARSHGDRASVKLVQIFIIWSHITDGEALTYLGMCIAAAEADCCSQIALSRYKTKARRRGASECSNSSHLQSVCWSNGGGDRGHRRRVAVAIW